MTTCSVAALNVTRNLAVPPSAAGAASAIDSAGRLPPRPAMSLIVPTPVSSSNVAPAGSLSSTVNPSSGSSVSSSRVATSIVRSVVPGSKVSVPSDPV